MLTCRLLGPVEVLFDDERIELGYPRQRTLLAILLVEANRFVALEALIDRIWGDAAPARAAHTLYADLSKLRRALTPVTGLHLVRQTAGYGVEADPAAIDLHRFHELVAQARDSDDERAATLLADALALWRGDAFADLDNPWLDTVRTSLHTERLTATLDRNDAVLRLGRHSALLADLATATTTHPLNERLAAQYLLALYRAGRSADALSHYQHVRAHLADELGVDPGFALQDVHERILRDDPDLRTGTPAPPPPAGRQTPRQLPAHAPHFVGRSVELNQLTELLDAGIDAGTDTGGAVMISAIGGAGGIGKTWLALHWAQQRLDRFPDGQLFVDLRGFTPAGDPMNPQAAVRGLLDGLGVEPERIPVDLDAQVALYRSLVAGRRMLIVLDNAADAAQVTPLLPGSPSVTVVITSRRYLSSLVTGHNARHLPLGVLTEPEARDLLRVRLGADRVAADAAAVDTLLSCCAGFPLALGIVIGRALAHPEFPLSVLAAELSDTTGALEAWDEGDAAASLPAVLSWSVRALTTEQARVFGLLGIAPGPDISRPAAAALTGRTVAAARVTLRELEHASLVQQHVPGRYRMHDLIHLYANDIARQELAGDAREQALRRVLDFYLHTARTAERLLAPYAQSIEPEPPAPGVEPHQLDGIPAALAWLDTEYAVLVAAQQTAARQAWYRTTWQFAWTLNNFLQRRGHRHDRLTMWRTALDAAEHLPDPMRSGIAHRLLGGALSDLGRHDEGIEHLRQALALAEEHDDFDQQAHTHRILAWAWERHGADRQAVAHATRARDLFRALDQPVWEASALSMVGWYAARLGEYDTARTDSEAALALHRRHNHPDGEAATLDSLGYIAHHTGEHRQAIDYYRESLTLRRALGNTYHSATTLANLGHPHVALGEHQQARAAWQEALSLYQDQGRDTDADRVRRELDALGPREPSD